MSKSLSQLVDQVVDTDRRMLLGNCAQFVRMGGFGVAYAPLLIETYHYVSFSARLLSKAISFVPATRSTIQAYLAEHLSEEVGHEQWALEDLKKLGVSRDDVLKTRPLEPTQRLVANQLFMIEFVSPVSILGYIYAMESTPPSEEVLDQIERLHELPPGSMSFLRGHSERDAVHREEIRALLDEETFSDVEANAIIRSALIAYRDLAALFDELCQGNFARDVTDIAA